MSERIIITEFYLPQTGSRAEELRKASDKFIADAQMYGYISDVKIAGPSVDHTGREIPDYYNITGILVNPSSTQ